VYQLTLSRDIPPWLDYDRTPEILVRELDRHIGIPLALIRLLSRIGE
jgi:hypothetical protein